MAVVPRQLGHDVGSVGVLGASTRAGAGRAARVRLVATLLPLLTGCKGIEDLVPIIAPTQACASSRDETVACTLDGDTFDVGACGDDVGERIRLLGVAAPEIAHDPNPAECWGDESWAWLDERVTGRTVTLEFDAECTDLYGRTLAWIFVTGDESDPLYDELLDLGGLGLLDEGGFEVLLNEMIIRAGQAEVYDEAFDDVRYFERMEEAEAAAQSEGLGLWTGCDE